MAPSDPAAIQYVGMGGTTKPCVEAIQRFLQFGDQPSKARILTRETHHGILLTFGEHDLVAVKSGFGSGYAGEGSHGLAYVLQLLEAHGVEIDEVVVKPNIFERIDLSALTQADIRAIERAKPVRPQRWHDYILDREERRGENKLLWRDFPPVIPFSIVDPRIIDLALTFWDDPDKRIITAFRRLESQIRARTGSEEHGSKLMAQALLSDVPKLKWPGLGSGEQRARCQLFSAAFATYRNPRSHREIEEGPEEQLAEFLVVNELYRLEKIAVDSE